MIKKGIMLLLLCSLAVSSLTGCTMGSIVGKGEIVDRDVKLSGSWSSIEISNIRNANIYLSNEQSNLVKYSIDEDLDKYLDVTENNGILVIKTKSDKTIKSKDGKSIDFYIGTNEVKDIKLHDYVKLEGIGEFSTDNFTLETSGAASVTLNLNCNNAKIDSDGASDINLQGKSETINVQMTGAGKLLAKDFETLDATVDLEGVATAEVYAQESLHVIGTGATKVTYWGEPRLTQEITGSGSVKQGTR